MKRTIKLENGFEATIDDAVMDDAEFVDLLADVEENPLRAGRILTWIYGKEGKKALYDHIRTKDGRVPVQAMNDAIEQTFNALGESEKN